MLYDIVGLAQASRVSRDRLEILKLLILKL